MSDLVQRLRDPRHDNNKCTDACAARVTAGEVRALLGEIDRLTRECKEWESIYSYECSQVTKLRAALERIIATESVDNDGEPMPETGACFIAREALKDGDNDPLASKDHGVASSAADETPLSAFVRSSPEEKERVYKSVMERASEQQRAVVDRAASETTAKLKADTGGGCSICGALPVVNVEGTYWLCGPCVNERISENGTGDT